ncbi:hypothetical protein [Sphingomonas sp. GM_Shp_2]|uniref:hypothetical protein n=1 Tax=Sphingomonas sp. GM_Shp_2 TaxID=2937380 RepID=UPI00226A9F7E|nr:hypothetical protein [Sphingomonas sp. GM_Shp_2]
MTYSVGTITLTNGSRVVTGTGTKFVANVLPGFLLIPVGGAATVIAEVNSDTQLTLARPWVAATMNGTPYDIVETAGGDIDLSLRALALLNTFGSVRDTVGQGLFPDGTVTSPGVRFINDQDTGIYRNGANTMVLATGGTARMWFDGSYGYIPAVISNSASNGAALTLRRTEASAANLLLTTSFPGGSEIALNSGVNGVSNDGFAISMNGTPRLIIDGSGNVLVGVTSGSYHNIQKDGVANGQPLIAFRQGGSVPVAVVYAIDFNGVEGANAANAAFKVGRSSTGRSISVSGSINTGGADYAEYMVKADGCGVIPKGDVCGVDRDGKLVKTWGDAVSFVIKSTDPSYVGGDTWAGHLSPRPEAPGAEPIEPAPPQAPPEGADDAVIAAWEEATAAYPGIIAAYKADHVAWRQATEAYSKTLPVWEAELEKARQCVDRIAFCGQVPANVSGDFEVGDYIIAAASGAGIKAVAVRADDMTLPQYMRRIGKVWAVRDGRAWIDVQHG